MIPTPPIQIFSLILVFTRDHILYNHCYNHPKYCITTSWFSALPNMFLVAFVVPFIFPTAANSPLVLVPFAFFLLKFMTTDCAIPGKIYTVRQKLNTDFLPGV